VVDFGDGDAGDQAAADATAVDPNAVYALGRSSGESDRLTRQADELRPESEALVERTGLGPGDRAIDVGCGPRGILDLLAERVSPGGSVVGLDADAALVAMASEFAASRGLDHVELVLADARDTGIESGSFDVVHARTLLINIPEPLEAMTEMVRLARPGGWVVGIEPDIESALCYPPLPAFDRLCELFEAAQSRNGADPHVGRRLADLYRRAGLEDVTVEASAVLYPPGHSRRTIRADLVQSIRPQILEMGLADEGELDELDAAARTHFNDPNTIVMPGLMFLGWGRKPTTA
jgi:ubiquinone/menaquinone biosynthesis C-methylase UbiE